MSMLAYGFSFLNRGGWGSVLRLKIPVFDLIVNVTYMYVNDNHCIAKVLSYNLYYVK